MTFVRACGTADVTAEKPHAVTVDDVEVAIVQVDDAYYAIRDQCSHAAVPLSEGDVEGCFIECWLHGSTFDLRTGEPTTLPAFEPVAIYPVDVQGDDLLVDVQNPLNGVQPD